MKRSSALTGLLVGHLLVRPLADTWRGTQVSSHFHHSGQSMALLSPRSARKTSGDSSVVSGLLVGACCRSARHPCSQRVFSGVLVVWVLKVHGFRDVVSCNTYDGVYSSARCVAAAYAGTAELAFIWLFWVQTAMTAPQQGLGLQCHGAPRFPYGSGETVGAWLLYKWGAEVPSGQETSKHEAETSSKPTCYKHLFNI